MKTLFVLLPLMVFVPPQAPPVQAPPVEATGNVPYASLVEMLGSGARLTVYSGVPKPPGSVGVESSIPGAAPGVYSCHKEGSKYWMTLLKPVQAPAVAQPPFAGWPARQYTPATIVPRAGEPNTLSAGGTLIGRTPTYAGTVAQRGGTSVPC